jgi:tetratricopeptide (TPR) repeat protein
VDNKAETLIDLEKEAEQFAQHRMWRKALANYNRILKTSPGSPVIHYKAALMEKRLGYSDLAIRHLEKAVALNPKYTEALLELGYCYLISKRYDKAEGMARVLLEADPKDVQARLLIGDTEALAGSYKKALAGIETLCTEYPDDPLLFLRKGDLNLVLGNRTQARAAYLKAMDMAPELPIALMSWANYCGLEGDAAVQEETLRRLSALDPENLLYTSFLGDFYFEHGRRDEGLRVYEEALNNTPGAKANPYFRARMIEVFLYTGKWDEAGNIISELGRLHPRGVEAPYFRGHLALAQGRFVDAVTAFRQAIHLGGPSDTIYFYLGLAQWLAGYVHQAQSSWQEALRLNPAFLQTLLHTAVLEISLGEYAMADKTLERVFYLLPDNREAHELLALRFLAKKDRKAFESQCRILTHMGSPPERLSLLKALGHDVSEGFCSTESGAAIPASPSQQRLHVTICGSDKYVGPLMDLAVAMDNNSSWAMGDNSWVIAHGSEMEDTAEWLYLKVRLALSQGRIEDAGRDLQKLKQHNNDDLAILHLETAIAECGKDLDEQIMSYRTLLRETPGNPEILNNLAWLLAQKDDGNTLREAQILAEKACDKKNSDPAFQDTRGWIYWKQGMNESARQAWDFAASLDPDNKFIQDHLELLKGHN